MDQGIIHDPARLLPAVTESRPGLGLVPVGGDRPWRQPSSLEPGYVLREMLGMQRCLSARPLRGRRRDLAAWDEDGVHFAAWGMQDGSMLVVRNDGRRWSWSLADPTGLIVDLKNRLAAGRTVARLDSTRMLAPCYRRPLGWAIRAACSSSVRERAVPEDARPVDLRAGGASTACGREVVVSYDGCRRIRRRVPGGMAGLHRLVDEMLARAWKAWSWCPARLLVTTHEGLRFVGFAVCYDPSSPYPFFLSLSLRALEIMGRQTLRLVIAHELCHVYQVQSDAAGAVPAGHCHLMHGQAFRELLARIVPGMEAARSIAKLSSPVLVESRLKRLRDREGSWLARACGRRKKLRHRSCRARSQRPGRGDLHLVDVADLHLPPPRLSWSADRGVVVWHRSPHGDRLTWRAASGRSWRPREFQGLVQATLLLAARFPRTAWSRVRVRQAGQHDVVVRDLGQLVRLALLPADRVILDWAAGDECRGLLARMEGGLVATPLRAGKGTPGVAAGDRARP
jgi:hypothetical protein